MYKLKYIFGQTVVHNKEKHKITGIKFTTNGVMYKLNNIKEWIKESDV